MAQIEHNLFIASADSSDQASSAEALTPYSSWRAPYGGDVGTTFAPGAQPGDQQPTWRKPYGGDASLVVQPNPQPQTDFRANNGNSNEVDPLTGRPIVRRVIQPSGDAANTPGPVNNNGGQQSDRLSDSNRSQQSAINRQRKLVDSALDYNVVGYGGNLVAGGIGGVLGARTVPWIMNKIADGATYDPCGVPTSMRGRVAKLWLDNQEPFSWKPGGYAQSILKGVGVAGTLMVVDHYADKMLFGKNHGSGIGDSINSALVPAALLIRPTTNVWKMGLVGAGALIAGKYIGSSLSEGENPSYSRIFSQSTSESMILAAEALLPLSVPAGKLVNWKQAALIAGTWLGFRGLNLVFGASAPGETKNKAFELLSADAKTRTDESMINAINKFGALGAGDESHGLMEWTNVFKEGWGKTKGARGEAALQVYRTEWLTRPTSSFHSMLEANRGAAILCTAFAESRLAHGTHIPTIVDAPTFLLAGKNIDLGGKAARDFIIARINIDTAEKQVQENLGKEIAGKRVDQSEIADLENVKKRIEADEAKIYGKHDMLAAVLGLAKWGDGLNAMHMAKLEVDLRNTIAANQKSPDSRYKAKLFRDLATIYLSSAYAKQEGDPQTAAKLLGGDTYSGRQAMDITGQQRGFDGALDCIDRAYELDSSNPDVAQLYEIAQQINAKLPGEIQRQMKDGRYNPQQIRQ